MFVNISCQQWNVGLFRKHLVVLRRQLQQFVILFKMEQIVTEVHNYIPILGQLFDGLAPDFSRLPVVALETQVPFLLPHQVRFLLHVGRGAA